MTMPNTYNRPATLHPVSLTVDQAAILAYAAITDDFNPIHVDPLFAAGTAIGRVIAHGTLSLNLIIQAIALSFGSNRAARTAIDIRFSRPVFVDDTVEAGGHEDPQAPGRFEVWVRKQDGTTVIEGTAIVPIRA